ncbi:hypothetical protein NL676_021110 [Syzygium grande]|nr:hypothetical protein NL676_021110 [Syzygium grande]
MLVTRMLDQIRDRRSDSLGRPSAHELLRLLPFIAAAATKLESTAADLTCISSPSPCQPWQAQISTPPMLLRLVTTMASLDAGPLACVANNLELVIAPTPTKLQRFPAARLDFDRDNRRERERATARLGPAEGAPNSALGCLTGPLDFALTRHFTCLPLCAHLSRCLACRD